MRPRRVTSSCVCVCARWCHNRAQSTLTLSFRAKDARLHAHTDICSRMLVSWNQFTARFQMKPAHLRAPLASANRLSCTAHTPQHILLCVSEEKTAPLSARSCADISILRAPEKRCSSQSRALPPRTFLAATDASHSVQSSPTRSLSCRLVQPSVALSAGKHPPPFFLLSTPPYRGWSAPLK